MTDPADAQTRARRSLLDMPAEEFRALGHALVEDIAHFYESLPGRRLTDASTPESVRALIGQGGLPESGEPADKLMQQVAPLLFEHSLHNGHPKFFGYITSSATPLGALADLLLVKGSANDLVEILNEHLMELPLAEQGMNFWDYGNAFLLEASRAAGASRSGTLRASARHSPRRARTRATCCSPSASSCAASRCSSWARTCRPSSRTRASARIWPRPRWW